MLAYLLEGRLSALVLEDVVAPSVQEGVVERDQSPHLVASLSNQRGVVHNIHLIEGGRVYLDHYFFGRVGGAALGLGGSEVDGVDARHLAVERHVEVVSCWV